MSGEQEQPNEGELIFCGTLAGTVDVDMSIVSYRLGEIIGSAEIAPEATLRKIGRVEMGTRRKGPEEEDA